MKKTELDVRNFGFRGTLYDSQNGSDAAIIVFIGSEGSIIPAGFIAERFADLGYNALALYYFGGEGLPGFRGQIPMEFVEKAISYLKEYDNGRIRKFAAYGDSIGSMPALMSGVLFQAITCIIAVSPTHVVTEGFLTRTKMSGNSFLTYNGIDLPYLPLPSGLKMHEMFQAAYKNTALGDIPVEQIQGRVLFIASELDEAWPAAYSVKRMESRLTENQFPNPHKALIFEKAGHLVGIMPDTRKHLLVPLISLAFKQERSCRKDCKAAREQSQNEIIKWLQEWCCKQ